MLENQLQMLMVTLQSFGVNSWAAMNAMMKEYTNFVKKLVLNTKEHQKIALYQV